MAADVKPLPWLTGEPYYCAVCGAGGGGHHGCEQLDCRLKTKEEAVERVRRTRMEMLVQDRDEARRQRDDYKRKLIQAEAVLAGWTRLDRIKLAAGEMTAQESRTALAVANAIAASVRSAMAASPRDSTPGGPSASGSVPRGNPNSQKIKAKKTRKSGPTAFNVAVNAGALTASLRDDQDELVATVWARLGQEISDVEALARILAAAPLLVPAVTKLLAAVEIAMDAEGDVFGRHHNDAVDALLEGNRALAIATGKQSA